jgi:hypothetical protein
MFLVKSARNLECPRLLEKNVETPLYPGDAFGLVGDFFVLRVVGEPKQVKAPESESSQSKPAPVAKPVAKPAQAPVKPAPKPVQAPAAKPAPKPAAKAAPVTKKRAQNDDWDAAVKLNVKKQRNKNPARSEKIPDYVEGSPSSSEDFVPGGQESEDEFEFNEAVASSGSDSDSPKDDTKNGKPVCKYGAGCYRKNEQHRAEFYHPQ